MRRASARRQGRRRHLTLDRIPGATRAPYPGFIEPCLATPRNSVPERGVWIHEIKHDGYRAQAHIIDGKAAIYTRRGFDWSDRFASIAETLQELGNRELILDGEVVIPDNGAFQTSTPYRTTSLADAQIGSSTSHSTLYISRVSICEMSR